MRRLVMIMKGRRPNLRHVLRTLRAALDWQFERTNWDHSISIRYVRPTEQLARLRSQQFSGSLRCDCLTFAHRQHQMSIGAFQNQLTLPLPSRVMSTAYRSQRAFDIGPWDEKPETPSYGVVSQRSASRNSVRLTEAPSSFAWRYPVQLTQAPSSRVDSSSSTWEHSLRSSEQESARPDDFSQEVCQDTERSSTHVAKDAHIEAMWERFGTRLHSSIELQKSI